MTTIIDPFHIATMGVCGEPITIATDGFIVELFEEIVTTIGYPGGAGGIPDGTETKKKKKRITAVVTIDGTTYTESVELDDLTITANDVRVSISENQTPKITLTIVRGVNVTNS